MISQPDVIFIDGLDFFSGAAALLRSSDWERASQCERCRTLDVLGRVGATVKFGTLLLMDR